MAALAFALINPVIAKAEPASLRVFLNGQEIQGSLIQTNGTIYLPLDAVTKALGAKVTIQTNQVDIATPQPVVVAGRSGASAVIRGTLTWQNHVYETKAPDMGARIWLVPESQVAAIVTAAGGTITEPIPQKAVGWEKNLTTEYHLPMATTDYRGDFSFDNAPSGKYLLILKSRQANGLAARDRDGKVRFLRIEVRDGQSADGSFNFGVTAYRN